MWYYSEDYYFKHFGRIEINIKALDNGSIGLRIYDHNNNQALEDSSYNDMEQVKKLILNHTNVSTNPPSYKELVKLKN